ncbi:c-type cytochrome [Amphiplicatus metriothermophilus]|uniref:Cytochrome c n=1 Tax=Amphiplicatus metriothermophilus TaxID=1519374 RepID=A0A239PQL4_9PROT|nr:c-type cytochrome [Amphiplicatus metriothermophilus]MBB5518420.1 cytochrome c [Amphiplicatus metriothermophilus]SNT72418.1 cytochrome c [Amphiplicatus metriothermophilus]
MTSKTKRSLLAWAAGAAAVVGLAACGREKPSEAPALSGAALGEREYRSCAICHASAPPGTPAGDARLVGPTLWGVYGQPAARLDGYAYSTAMREADLIWDAATLDAFIANPQAVVRGTRMSYAGEPNPEKRAAIIEYLKTLQ